MQWIQWPNHLLSVIPDSRREVWKIIQLLIWQLLYWWYFHGEANSVWKALNSLFWEQEEQKPYMHTQIYCWSRCEGWIWFTCTAEAPLVESCDLGMKITASTAHFPGYFPHKVCLFWRFLSNYVFFFNKCVSNTYDYFWILTLTSECTVSNFGVCTSFQKAVTWLLRNGEILFYEPLAALCFSQRYLQMSH